MRIKKSERIKEAKWPLKQRIKQHFCSHEFSLVWKADYDRYICKKKGPFLLNLSGSEAIEYCPKCGKAKKGIFVPVEEESWANHCMIRHFECDKEV